MIRKCATNPYVEIMHRDYSPWVLYEFDEAPPRSWRNNVFQTSKEKTLNLEIGTGNGFHFAHATASSSDQLFLGMEIKFKPLVQTVRRCLRQGSQNFRMLKADANCILELFSPEELDNVYIHHPDPWPKKRHLKNRLIQKNFLLKLHKIIKPEGHIEFKTDHEGYFQSATEHFKNSPFEISYWSENLHQSHRSDKNFVTGFEKIFLEKQQPIYYCLLKKT